jgi:hypothetical protein
MPINGIQEYQNNLVNLSVPLRQWNDHAPYPLFLFTIYYSSHYLIFLYYSNQFYFFIIIPLIILYDYLNGFISYYFFVNFKDYFNPIIMFDFKVCSLGYFTILAVFYLFFFNNQKTNINGLIKVEPSYLSIYLINLGGFINFIS